MSLQAVLTDAKVLRHEQLKPGFCRLTLSAPEIAQGAKPGQFVQVRVNRLMDPLLPRPISFHGIDTQAGTITLLYHIAGRGTQELSEVNVGQPVSIWGPLGKGWAVPEEIHSTGTQVLPIYVAGGIGIAPLLPLAAKWSDRGKPGILLYGGRTEEQLLALEDFEKLGVQSLLACEDGSIGIKGRVTELFNHIERTDQKPLLYACGPKPMLNAVQQIALNNHWLCQVSLEERMGCGLGACLSCVCKTKADDNARVWTHSKVCTDGPVFWSDEVIWDG